jgi:hypothetical protein
VVKVSDSVPGASGTRLTRDIEKISEGDLVLARDERTGRLAPKRVVETYIRTSDHLRILQIRSSDGAKVQELKTTDEHPFWVQGLGWVEAGKLVVVRRSSRRTGREVGSWQRGTSRIPRV